MYIHLRKALLDLMKLVAFPFEISPGEIDLLSLFGNLIPSSFEVLEDLVFLCKLYLMRLGL